MFSMLFVLYKPTYEVKFEGEVLGYISDKADVQKQISNFLQNGDKDNVGYVILKEEPTYEFSFVKKDTCVSDDEIVAKVIDACDVYYRVYGVNVDDEEKFVVDTVKEAQEIVDKINEEQKDYQKKSTIEISEKFVQEYTLPDDIEVAVNDINKTLKDSNDEYVKSQVKTVSTSYAAYTSSSYTVPESVLLAMQSENGSLNFSHPLNSAGIITSRYGLRSRNNHKGIDIGAPTGTPIYAAEDGIVTYSGWYYGYGYLIKIQHINGYETYYGHCSKLACNAGDSVTKGTLIGYVGSTGNSTGPHLHFEVRMNGNAYNPEQFIN
ncbi:MAG: M23 family metallopeptidase [Clostridia bacterium]|nr:M23 family metallopeptidase [Clostridia bacterium]